MGESSNQIHITGMEPALPGAKFPSKVVLKPLMLPLERRTAPLTIEETYLVVMLESTPMGRVQQIRTVEAFVHPTGEWVFSYHIQAGIRQPYVDDARILEVYEIERTSG